MIKLLMLRGLPASGKSTYAKELARKPDWKRVNKDDLRSMIDGGKWSKANEKNVLIVRDMICHLAIGEGINVVVDDTNLNPEHEKTLREIADAHGAVFETMEFEASLDECIKRDNLRPNGVGEAVIRRMWRESVLPKIEWPEDRDRKQEVIICDLDGTIANLGKRNPYDASMCEQDECHDDVLDLVKSFGLPIVFCSGREDKYREQTRSWLRSHLPGCDAELFMRPTGDNRPDWQIKFEILRDQIAPMYNPIAVFDDRNQVVDMWRKQGLRVYQVADGNF